MKTKNALARKVARAAVPRNKPTPRAARRIERSPRRRGDTTRLAILNAAERCFGEAGFDGVSLRTITEVAGVDLALANYHFGSKDNLLREVIARRARIVHDERVRALEAARHEAGARSPSVEAIVAAFLEPLLRRLMGGDRGWRHYGRLASQLDVLPQFVGLTSEVLDPTALHFINALRLALPKAPPRSIYWGYMFLIGSMVQVMSATGRIERLSRGLCRSDDIEGALRELVPFVSAGLRALQSNPDNRNAGRKAAVNS
ncbi:MAG: TetR/AcrR family transcriptional regulator [Xanthobacteraceae bacterium]